MNKMMKGSVAGAAGIALLMGGFGTYALWSDSETLEGSEITSGTLDVDPGDVTWVDQNDVTWQQTDLMVPGDIVTRTQSFDFSTTGKNMIGTIKFTPGTITEFTGGDDQFTVDVSVTGITDISGAGGCFEFSSAGADTADTVVTYALTADDQDLQDVTASITDSTFVIEQGHTCP